MIAAVAIAALALVAVALGAVIWAVRLILGRIDQWQLDYAARQDDRVEAERARWELEVSRRELAAADDHITALVEATRAEASPAPSTFVQLAESWRRRRALAAGEVSAGGAPRVPAGPAAGAAGPAPVDRPD